MVIKFSQILVRGNKLYTLNKQAIFFGKVFWDFEKWTKKMSKNENPKILSRKKNGLFL
jgi:hypothetical protein